MSLKPFGRRFDRGAEEDYVIDKNKRVDEGKRIVGRGAVFKNIHCKTRKCGRFYLRHAAQRIRHHKGRFNGIIVLPGLKLLNRRYATELHR